MGEPGHTGLSDPAGASGRERQGGLPRLAGDLSQQTPGSPSELVTSLVSQPMARELSSPCHS
jgi:hypothetical protein